MVPRQETLFVGIFDFIQGITAVARSKPQKDARLAMETRAKTLLERAA